MRKGQKLKTVDQLYSENQEVLLEAGYTKDIFEANMKTIMKENNVRTSKAWRIFKHKTDFTDKTVIGAENMVQGIKTLSKEDYKAFRKEVVGWKEKIDYSKFSYDEDQNKYKYENAKGDSFMFTLVTGPYGSQYWSWEKI